jgi:hypothetical protein
LKLIISNIAKNNYTKSHFRRGGVNMMLDLWSLCCLIKKENQTHSSIQLD